MDIGLKDVGGADVRHVYVSAHFNWITCYT